ncbi:MAG: MFS transporter [Holosporales bacterium]|jgi:MFS family permease|nr:MFS transporter [Holosporales bacterium]
MRSANGFFYSLKQAIPGSVWAIGIAALLANISTSVVFACSALYLKTMIGVEIITIGYLEAIVEATSYGVRIFSGVLSDYFRKRKVFIVIGFVFIAISKPLLSLSKSFNEVLLARIMDRVGNGVQATPREALISDLAKKEHKGSCFGLRQSLAVVGSTLGGLFGIIVMKCSHYNFKLLFMLASIPAFMATFILIAFVHDKKRDQINADTEKEHKHRKLKIHDMKLLGTKFWILMLVVILTMCGRFSEVFITLHACSNFGLDMAYGTLITLIYNLLTFFVSYPVGKLSDRVSRVQILFVGIFFLFLSHLTLGLAGGLMTVFMGTVFWGVQRGIADSMFAVLVSDYVPKDLRGTGFGVYYLIVSASTATACALAGTISQWKGEHMAFLYGACVCTLAMCLLFICRKRLVPHT